MIYMIQARELAALKGRDLEVGMNDVSDVWVPCTRNPTIIPSVHGKKEEIRLKKTLNILPLRRDSLRSSSAGEPCRSGQRMRDP